ncbi:hypothetical protein RJ641_023169 [Dillenia turbinata]|uniref:Uncharacterized protein n=1 Tax=Dillenia turbinata TaxID=194707 RepID=A0AAN8UAW6_9MAGN
MRVIELVTITCELALGLICPKGGEWYALNNSFPGTHAAPSTKALRTSHRLSVTTPKEKHEEKSIGVKTSGPQTSMKRKKWSEREEQTLISKYSELLNSGTLAKLKTREKKFKPIAEHVNSIHHLQDPHTYPFKWSWRDVSIKVQNMRHQYIGVKQKIRGSNGEFNWRDGEDHWENFLKYKEVFGDVDIDVKSKRVNGEEFDLFSNGFGDNGSDILGLGFDREEFEDDDDEGGTEEGEEVEDSGAKRAKNGLGLGLRRIGSVVSRVLETRDMGMRRKERSREREFRREQGVLDRDERRREREIRNEERRDEVEERIESQELELEERQMAWMRRDYERRMRLEREFDEERRRRMKVEERREEEEMEWRERMVELQIEHEKRMMQMHADACLTQMQILGSMARLLCQFFGSANDGLGGGLGALPPQVMQNIQHPEGLGENGKNDVNSPSEFI